ncbi:MAG: CRISPR-associated endonuclease Cas1 3 [Candidatus Binatia bacterium]|nr:MAG: CRISPR-associated endonuclease Cas1 3 [Candidatus Binatia bacterium]
MKTAYITEPGATVRRNGSVLEVWLGNVKRTELLVHDLDQLVLMGNIVVTPAVLDFLVNERIDTVFLSLHGKFRGRLMHHHSKNVTLRLAQYDVLRDRLRALDFARRFVHGKIANMRAFLFKAGRRHSAGAPLTEMAYRLGAVQDQLAEATTLDEVRGFEGRASALYFEVFPHLLKNSDFQFTGRNRRPPLDPVNVLLSLGYTLLANAVETAVQIVGLDPYVGALHEIAYGRPSLVCDLMEEYRAMIVDPMVVACINQRVFSTDDFEPGADGEPVRFKREAMKYFIELFERRIRNEILYPPRNQRLKYRQVIEEQVRHFARCLLGHEQSYEPFVVR